MKCCICNKEIYPYLEEYQPLGYDGDMIHKECMPKWEKFIQKIDNMTDQEFSVWLTSNMQKDLGVD